MRNNPKGVELDPEEDVRRACKNNYPSILFLSCISKRTKDGCDYGSEVRTFHNGWDEKGPVSLRK